MRFRYLLNFSPDWFEWSQRRVYAAYEKALYTLAERWHRGTLPKHFEFSAHAEYGYTPRSRGYEKRKAIRERHRRPLVGVKRKNHAPGQLRAMVTGTARIRATRSRVRVDMPAPNYVRYRGRKGTGPDMQRELTEVNARESAEMVRQFHELVRADLESQPRRRAREIT